MYMSVLVARRGPKRWSDSLELKQQFVSRQVGAGNYTWVICKSTKFLNHCNISPAPDIHYYFLS